MNDNIEMHVRAKQQQAVSELWDVKRLADLTLIASRALTAPEEMSAHEMQDVSWAFLLLAKKVIDDTLLERAGIKTPAA